MNDLFNLKNYVNYINLIKKIYLIYLFFLNLFICQVKQMYIFLSVFKEQTTKTNKFYYYSLYSTHTFY